MSDTTIHVGICLDERILNAAFVLLASIKTHARAERPVHVYAITSFPAHDLHELATLMACDRFSLTPIEAKTVKGTFPIRDHITEGTYLRFLLPDLLPDVKKIIYLDVDTVVHHDLAPLFDTDLAGHAMAGMPDHSMLLGSKTWPTFFIPYQGRNYRFHAYAEAILGLPCSGMTEYFNCGVLILDLDLWRKQTIAARTIAYLKAHPNLYLMDQDALNHIIAGAYIPIDARWNAFAKNAGRPAVLDNVWLLTAVGRAWDRVRALWRRDPWIVHYAGANKPWIRREAKTAKDAIWWRYAMQSPMAETIVSAYRAIETVDEKRRGKIPSQVGPPKPATRR